MQAEQINANLRPNGTEGWYISGRTAKEYLERRGYSVFETTEGHAIVDDEMYFVNEHGVWLVE